MAPPPLIQPASPAPAFNHDSQALVRTVAIGDYTAAYRARCSTAEGASTTLSMVSLPPVAAPTTTPAVVVAPAQHPGADSADPIHHMSTLTPPAALPPGALKTPNAAQIIYPVSTLQNLGWRAGIVLRIAGFAKILGGPVGLQIRPISNCKSGMDCA